MGYESNGHGIFRLRDPTKEKEAEEAISLIGIEIDTTTDEQYYLSFSGMRLYRAGAEMKIVAKYFNGEFEIAGDDIGDLWCLQFKDGKAFKRQGKITYGEPVETNLDSSEWGD